MDAKLNTALKTHFKVAWLDELPDSEAVPVPSLITRCVRICTTLRQTMKSDSRMVCLALLKKTKNG